MVSVLFFLLISGVNNAERGCCSLHEDKNQAIMKIQSISKMRLYNSSFCNEQLSQLDIFCFYDSCDSHGHWTVYLVYLLVNITSGYKLALLKIAPDDWKACTAVCIEVVEIQNDFKYYHITKYTKAM